MSVHPHTRLTAIGIDPRADTLLDTYRDLDRKLRVERWRNGDHTPKFRELEREASEVAVEIADFMLASAIVWDDREQETQS